MGEPRGDDALAGALRSAQRLRRELRRRRLGASAEGGDEVAPVATEQSDTPSAYGIVDAVMSFNLFGAPEEHEEHNIWGDDASEQGSQVAPELGSEASKELGGQEGSRRKKKKKKKRREDPAEREEADADCEGPAGTEAAEPESSGASQFYEAVMSLGFFGGVEAHDIYADEGPAESPARRVLRLRQQRRSRKGAVVGGVGLGSVEGEAVPSIPEAEAVREVANGWLCRARERLEERRQRHHHHARRAEPEQPEQPESRFFDAVMSLGFFGGAEVHDIHDEGASEEPAGRRLKKLHKKRRSRKGAVAEVRLREAGAAEGAADAAHAALRQRLQRRRHRGSAAHAQEDTSSVWGVFGAMVGLGTPGVAEEPQPPVANHEAARDAASGWLSRARQRLEQRRQRQHHPDPPAEEAPGDAEDAAGAGFSMAWLLAAANPFGAATSEEEEEFNIWGSDEEDVQKRTNAFKTAQIAHARRRKPKGPKPQGSDAPAEGSAPAEGGAPAAGAEDRLKQRRPSQFPGAGLPPGLCAGTDLTGKGVPSLSPGDNGRSSGSAPEAADAAAGSEALTVRASVASARRPSRPSLYFGSGDVAAGAEVTSIGAEVACFADKVLCANTSAPCGGIATGASGSTPSSSLGDGAM